MGQAARAQHQVSSHSQPVTTGRQAKVDCLDDDCSTICCRLGPAPWGLGGSRQPQSYKYHWQTSQWTLRARAQELAGG